MFEGRIVSSSSGHNEEISSGAFVDDAGDRPPHHLVDDASMDGTASALASCGTATRVCAFSRHPKRRGCGHRTGYKTALEEASRQPLVVVMAGDAQRTPTSAALLHPSPPRRGLHQGHRLRSGEAWKILPPIAYLGTSPCRSRPSRVGVRHSRTPPSTRDHADPGWRCALHRLTLVGFRNHRC